MGLNGVKQAVTWTKDVKVTVNLAPRQFECGDLHQVVTDALAQSGIPRVASNWRLPKVSCSGTILRPTKCCTSCAPSASVSRLTTLAPPTPRSALRSFPFDKIKIDQTVIRDHPERNECVAIINAVTGLARQLQMTTVAEVLETLDHVNTAVVAGCDEVQGFYFSKPVRADEVEALLARNSPQSSAA